MMRKIPKLKDDKALADFWDNHSAADYVNEMTEVSIELEPELESSIKSRSQSRLKMVSLRLREEQIEAVKNIAAARDIPYQTLIRSWIALATQAEQKHMTPGAH